MSLTAESPSATRRCRTPETWERAKADYLAGLGAPEVCERYDLGLTALRDRARREGWRRADRPDPDPLEDDFECWFEDEARSQPADLTAVAWARLSRALHRGSLREAQAWSRVHGYVAGLAAAREWQDKVAESRAASRAPVARHPDSPDSPDGLFAAAAPRLPTDQAAAPNRAERRRALALERSRR